MSPSHASSSALINAAQAKNPAVRFVPLRGLRRVIRRSRPWEEFSARVPHEFAWPISRAELVRILPLAELGIRPDDPASEFLLLPNPDESGHIRNLRDVWKILFHARIDAAIDRRFKNPDQVAALKSSRHALGATFWHEVQSVLESQDLIAEADPDEFVYREFIAFLLELHFFTPEAVPDFFPGLEHPQELIDQLVSEFDAALLFEETRPEGEAKPVPVSPHAPAHAPTPKSDKPFPIRETNATSPPGNDVKAAILLARENPHAANGPIESLANRIGNLLQLDAAEQHEWTDCLRKILEGMTEEGWSTERRLLYDLQRACLAVEQQIFTADLIEWMVTFGQQPVKRLLTKHRWLLVGRHLRAAARRAASLAPRQPFQQLEELLHHAFGHAEQAGRTELRPIITDVLNEVGLRAENLPETVSHRKIVEELLDTAWERGYLRIGDFRDALARSRIKLPDLSGPSEFFVGDPLIRANRLLAVRLDGVYHRGEVYMRVLQRICSLFFGTPVGRFFSLFIALPFGGAFVFLEAVHHMLGAAKGLLNWLGGWNKIVDGFQMVAGTAAGHVIEHPHMGKGFDWTAFWIIGCVLFLLIHWRAFRRVVGQYSLFFFFKLPSDVAKSPLVRMTFDNAATRFYRRYFLLPTVTGLFGALMSWLIGYEDWENLIAGLGVALTTMILVRTTFGRGIEDRFNEAVARAWRVLSVNFVMGVLTFVLRIFNAILEAIDRAIYAVDESLRFRQGQSSAMFAAKLLLGFGWFLFTYVFRFAWNLLVEPQINPIKHFPVVTVSHKMLLPLIPSLSKQFAMNEKTMGVIVSGIPGMFGFLVWELKENWKLYKANAAKTIRPAIVGSHGEKMRALLRPGFHSGVVPKTWAKLRTAAATGNHHRVVKHHHHLHHIAESLHHLLERGFVAYLVASHRWAGLAVHAEFPRMATNRVRFPIQIGDEGTEVLISIEERGGWLIASVEHPESLTLSPGQQAVWDDALAGLYKLIGVDAIREQVAAVLGETAGEFDAIPEGLLVPKPDGSVECYDYNEGPEILRHDRRLAELPLVFSGHDLPWDDWVACWKADEQTPEDLKPVMPGWRLTAWPNQGKTSTT
ncbi:hypothetical protein [Zavarzinella formosa]|uniref:hypothetical protein n=1 Tax=Zavarzinella formosa TaxID=360055 RepID=UPI00037D8C31|nr:hypothetical protein [Zavarzinella formosa]